MAYQTARPMVSDEERAVQRAALAADRDLLYEHLGLRRSPVTDPTAVTRNPPGAGHPGTAAPPPRVDFPRSEAP